MKNAKLIAIILVVAMVLGTVGCAKETPSPTYKIPKMIKVTGGTVVCTGDTPENSYANRVEGIFVGDRSVTLSDFHIGKYEVTQEEYASVIQGEKINVDGIDYPLQSNSSYNNGDKKPVEQVTWFDAVYYCNLLSEKAGLEPVYTLENIQMQSYKNPNDINKTAIEKDGYYIFSADVTFDQTKNGYRLLTEAEWEFAARGGYQSADAWNYQYSGSDNKGEVFNESYDTATGQCNTYEVGTKNPNTLGLYDMSGNVVEWCYDWYGAVRSYDETNPIGPESVEGPTGNNGQIMTASRTQRGAPWDTDIKTRCFSQNPNYLWSPYGFRVARNAK